MCFIVCLIERIQLLVQVGNSRNKRFFGFSSHADLWVTVFKKLCPGFLFLPCVAFPVRGIARRSGKIERFSENFLFFYSVIYSHSN